MKIGNNLIDNFIKSDLTNLKSSILYGQDEGVIFERKNLIIKQILGESYDKLHLIEFDQKQVVNDFHIVIDEANAFSLIPGRKLILIYNASDQLHQNISDYLGLVQSDSFLLLIGGDLSARSKLRKLYETDKTIVSLPCYNDDERSLRDIVINDLKQDGFSISYDLASYIANNFYGNRQVLRSELLKLKFYCKGKENVTFDDVESIISGSKENNFQDFANKIANLETDNLLNQIEHYNKFGANNITLCRVLINYFTKLHLAASYRSQDMTNSDAVAKLRPPVFFKQKSIMINHMGKWSNDKIFDFLAKMQNYELLLKKNSSSEFCSVLFADFLTKFLKRV
ncbi:MAG: DNA polymerase III subunit delta [Rickettsiales bacterium]|nr:DNA polymerase III subunit delta [Rickettsiales bacterium]